MRRALRLKKGTVYALERKASRELDVRFLGATGHDALMTWLLVRLEPRANARRGRATQPQLIRKEWYELVRSGSRLRLQLLEQFRGPDGRYLLLQHSIIKMRPTSPKVSR